MEGGSQNSRSSLFGWIGGIVLVLVLYVASTGPVFCCCEKYAGNNDVLADGISIFYYPIFYVAEKNEIFREYFDWYIVNLWV